jgi:hypothetical protein
MGLLKRIGLVAMLLAVGSLVLTDAGLPDLRSIALADHNDHEDDDNKEATDRDEDDDDDEAEELSGRQRCRERPFPAECRRRKKQQERKSDKRGNDGKKDGDGPTASPTASPSASPSPAPAACPFDAIPAPIGPALCDLIGGVPVAVG